MTANLMYEVGQAKIHELYDRAERRETADAIRAAHRHAHSRRVRARRSVAQRLLSLW